MNALESLNFNDSIITVSSDFSPDCGDCDTSMRYEGIGDCPCDCRCD